jgi:hypothetical protein
MRVLVCGGRDFTDKALLYNTLYALCEEFGLKSEPDEYGNWATEQSDDHPRCSARG